MNIAIALDGVLTNDREALGLALFKFCKKYNLHYSIKKEIYHGISDMMDWTPDIVADFWRENIDSLLSNPKLNEDAAVVVNSLHRQGHSVQLLTERESCYGWSALETTEKYLQRNDVHYDKLAFKCYRKDTYCSMHNIGAFLSADVNDCLSVAYTKRPTFLLKGKYAKDVSDPSYRVVENIKAFYSAVHDLDCIKLSRRDA